MPNDNVQTLTGHPVLDAPVRNAQTQTSEASAACFQDAQSTWKKPEDIAPGQQNGDNVTTQMQGLSAKAEQSKCVGLPNLDIDGLDSNMGPFDPNGRSGPDVRNNPHQGGRPELNAVPGYGDKPEFEKPESGKLDLQKNQFGKNKDDIQIEKMKEKLDGNKCGGSEITHPETPTTQRRMSESERIIEQKIIDQKLREMKLRERYRL